MCVVTMNVFYECVACCKLQKKCTKLATYTTKMHSYTTASHTFIPFFLSKINIYSKTVCAMIDIYRILGSPLPNKPNQFSKNPHRTITSLMISPFFYFLLIFYCIHHFFHIPTHKIHFRIRDYCVGMIWHGTDRIYSKTHTKNLCKLSNGTNFYFFLFRFFGKFGNIFRDPL